MANVVNQQGEVIGTVIPDVNEATKVVQTVEGDLVKVKADIKTQGIEGWLKANTRTLEKLIAYGAAAVGATNGFTTVQMPNSLRVVLVAAGGVAVALDKIVG